MCAINLSSLLLLRLDIVIITKKNQMTTKRFTDRLRIRIFIKCLVTVVVFLLGSIDFDRYNSRLKKKRLIIETIEKPVVIKNLPG